MIHIAETLPHGIAPYIKKFPFMSETFYDANHFTTLLIAHEHNLYQGIYLASAKGTGSTKGMNELADTQTGG